MIKKTVRNPTQGLKTAKTLIYKYVDKKTALFLSGGTTPKLLYEVLAKEKKLNPGVVVLIDERYGLPFHLNSNEKMIRDTGLLSYLEGKKIPFYSILRLHPEGVASELAIEYDKAVRGLFTKFRKRIAIMGIGEDGHTAGLPPGIKNSTHSTSSGLMLSEVEASKLKIQNYVTEIKDFPGEFKERITLTFKALSKMDLLIILVFGFAKQRALKLMFEKGSKEEVPARFYTEPGISEKTILITDQKV